MRQDEEKPQRKIVTLEQAKQKERELREEQARVEFEQLEQRQKDREVLLKQKSLEDQNAKIKAQEQERLWKEHIKHKADKKLQAIANQEDTIVEVTEADTESIYSGRYNERTASSGSV